MKYQKTLGRGAAITLVSLLALGGCGGGSSGSGTGKLNLGITDAPVDSAEEVVVTFTGIELKPAAGESIVIDFEQPKQIDLLKLQGGEFEFLTKDYVLPVGEYLWIRLDMLNDEKSIDSYITFKGDDTRYPLYIPSYKSDNSSLKLDKNNFTVYEDKVVNLTIDFDLRKSLVDPKNSTAAYKLKPVLRLVQNTEAGHIEGTVSEGFYAVNPACAGAVYLYEGFSATLDDFDMNAPEPVSSGLVKLNADTGQHEYGIGFVAAGNYTVAFTCEADMDATDQNDDILFLQSADVIVEAMDISEADFIYTP